MFWIVILVLLVILIGASAPAYPYSRSWGYGPAGVLAALLVVLLVLWLVGAISINLGGGTSNVPVAPASPGRP